MLALETAFVYEDGEQGKFSISMAKVWNVGKEIFS